MAGGGGGGVRGGGAGPNKKGVGGPTKTPKINKRGWGTIIWNWRVNIFYVDV